MEESKEGRKIRKRSEQGREGRKKEGWGREGESESQEREKGEERKYLQISLLIFIRWVQGWENKDEF